MMAASFALSRCSVLRVRTETSCRSLSRPSVFHCQFRAPAATQDHRGMASLVRALEGEPSAAMTVYDLETVDTYKEALDLGVLLCTEKRWGEALAIFEKSLTLPGTGLKRFRDKPRTISDVERAAALYNMACCHARLNDARTALVSLAGCMEAGFENYKQIRSDPDLEIVRADERFEVLMTRFQPKKSEGMFGSFFDGFKS